MKQIFDWLREQISKLHKKNPYDSYWERDMYLATNACNAERDKTIQQIHELINEAEAKQGADCCTQWDLKENATFMMVHGTSHLADEAKYWKYCPYCGKRIKILEVEQMTELIDRKKLIGILEKYKFGGISSDIERDLTKETVIGFVTMMPTVTTTEADIRAKAISDFADKLIINFSDWQMSLAEVGNEKEFDTIDKAMIGIEKIAEQLKGE